MITDLFQPITVGDRKIQNRIVFPPMLCFGWGNSDGLVTPRHIHHYLKVAKGGAGMIIVESTAVRKDARITSTGLGIWMDAHVHAFGKLTRALKKSNSLVILQINHSGLKTPADIAELCKGPSANPADERSAELTLSEIDSIKKDYIQAGIRAINAGFDGIELHGAHGYLLNQFASPLLNRRTDNYGGSTKNRLKLAHDIINGIRAGLKQNIIIGYRLGVNSPTVQDGIDTAVLLEQYGFDYIHVSHGGNMENLPVVPDGIPYNGISYSSKIIKENVKIPVIAVNNIRTPERAAYILENNWADMVAIGKDMLTDPYWPKHTKEGKAVNGCHLCQPACHWYTDSNECPGRAEWKS